MTRPTLPDNWEELMADYVLGNLSPEDAETVQQLLNTYPELTSDVTHLQEVLNLIPHALPEIEPPPHLRTAILEAAQAGLRTAPYRSWRRSPVAQQFPGVWMGVASAAAILLVLTLAIDNYSLRQELHDTRLIASILKQPGVVVRTMRGTDGAIAGGSIVIDPRQQKMVVAVHNLPQPDAGQTYRLWAITQQGQVNYCGQFETDTTGIALATLILPEAIANVTTSDLRITLESAAAPLTPQGSLVMQSSL